MNDLLLTIADPKTNRDALIQAIQDLTQDVVEPAQFWADIANNVEYSKDHRRRAIFELFRRHVAPGMTIFELAKILDNPNWLAEEDIYVIIDLAGEIPVELTADDTVFVLNIFPDLPDGRYQNWAIYLRVSGKVDTQDFFNLLQGDETVSSSVKEAEILEFALVPDDPTNVDW